jgi:hypothetical protein
MSGALRRPITVDEFLAWERRQELRHEFDGIRAVAMTGGTIAHSIIGTNLVWALEDRPAGKPCRAFRGDLKILAARRIRYPDALATRSPVSQQSGIVPDPVVSSRLLRAPPQ